MSIDRSSLILVAVVNDPRDLEIARVLGWYRIPLKSAPKVISVDFLAFYQTSSFGEDKWRIAYTAPVQGHELTTRQELLRSEADHPHAHHEYFKIQLGPLERLSEPILAKKWRRITFFYTTGAYLLSAKTVDDLVLQSTERQILWKALRERAAQKGDISLYQSESDASLDFEVDAETLAMLLGIREAES